MRRDRTPGWAQLRLRWPRGGAGPTDLVSGCREGEISRDPLLEAIEQCREVEVYWPGRAIASSSKRSESAGRSGKEMVEVELGVDFRVRWSDGHESLPTGLMDQPPKTSFQSTVRIVGLRVEDSARSPGDDSPTSTAPGAHRISFGLGSCLDVWRINWSARSLPRTSRSKGVELGWG